MLSLTLADDTQIVYGSTPDDCQRLKDMLAHKAEMVESAHLHQDAAHLTNLLELLLAGTISLDEMRIDGGEISSEQVTLLCDLIEEDACPLSDLSLTDLTIPDIEKLITAIANNSSLTSLTMQNIGNAEPWQHLFAAVLEKNSTLTELNLSGNKITSQEAKAFAGSLNQNTTLTELNLSSNNITSQEAEALAEGLNLNTTLTELDLSGNPNMDDGLVGILDTLVCNTTLHTLNLGPVDN